MRIFVTGANGVLGRHVCRHLVTIAPDAEVIPNSADLTQADAIKTTLAEAGALDLVLHLAALVPVTEVKNDPARAYAVNVTGTANLMAGLAANGQTPRVLYCSSSHVYASSADPLREDAPTDPVSLYGKTKMLGEQAASYFAQAADIDLCIARVFSIHDPTQTGPYLRPALMRRFETEDLTQPFKLPGANSLRDFLTAEEAARRVVLLATSTATGVVNVGSGIGTKVADFAQSLAPSPLDIHPIGEPDVLVADVTRLHALLGDLHV